jgi:hypothetical protein
MATPFVLTAVEGTATPAQGAASLGPAVLLTGTIVLLLGLFAAGAILLARSHRRRLARSGPRPAEPLTDAWQEAGRRLGPPD